MPKDPRPDVTKTLEIPAQEPIIGTVLAGRYRVIEELGRGGMGRVFLVFDEDVKEKIALKLLNPEIAADSRTIERFSQELKLARKIRHKNICGMFDLGKADGLLYLTMEFVPGEDLKRLIRNANPFAAEKAIPIAEQVCEGLAEAHRLGVVHRDLKPSNIMVDEDWNVRIMDFGIARSVREERITEAGVMIGTPEYMSPEQVEGRPVDQRSDIYALGIILYEMLTGRVPFEGDSPLSVAHKQKYEKPLDPGKLNPQIPEDLSRLILCCLEKEADLRYQTAGDVLDDLTRIEQGLPAKGREITGRQPLRAKKIYVSAISKRAVWPALIVVGVVLAGLAVWKFALRKLPASEQAGQTRSIAVISFENQTGDKNYDYLSRGLPDTLSGRLEESGYMSVMTWDRLRDLLKQAKKPDVQFISIDKDLGLELCRLDGTEILAQGSFIKTGAMIAINVRLYDVASNRLLRSVSTTGEGDDSILKSQIDELCRAIARGVGVSNRLVAADHAKTAEMMTSSAEAYKWYTLGYEAYSRLYYADAQRYLEKAVEIDPGFAMAFLRLYSIYTAFENFERANKAIAQAKNLAGRLSERDRLLVEATYAGGIEKDPPKREAILEELVRKYPKDKTSLISLANVLKQKGDFERAVGLLERARALDPYDPFPVTYLMKPLISLGRVDEAIAAFKEYLARVPGDANANDSLGMIYVLSGDLDGAIAAFKDAEAIKPGFSLIDGVYPLALKEDYGEALDWLDRAIRTPRDAVYQFIAYLYKGFIHYWLGSSTKALGLIAAAERLAEDKKINLDTSAHAPFLRSWIDLEREETQAVRQEIDKFSAVSTDNALKDYPLPHRLAWDGLADLALVFFYFKTAQLDLAETTLEKVRTIMDQITKALYEDPDAALYRDELGNRLSHLSAELALQRGRPQDVTGSFDRLAPFAFFPLHQYLTAIFVLHFPSMQDVKARAWLKLGEIDKAIAEYERLTTFDPKSRERFLIHPLCYYRLGKLYEQKGLQDKAKARYERFLDLWKDADPGRPEVTDAAKRLAALKGS